jgi:hypothetical protein
MMSKPSQLTNGAVPSKWKVSTVGGAAEAGGASAKGAPPAAVRTGTANVRSCHPQRSGFVAFIAVTVSALVIIGAAVLSWNIAAPASWLGVIGAFVASVLCFAAIGVLLGALLPTPRAAQGVGVLLWFGMFLIAGSGPPPEVLPMRRGGWLITVRVCDSRLVAKWLVGAFPARSDRPLSSARRHGRPFAHGRMGLRLVHERRPFTRRGGRSTFQRETADKVGSE